MDKTEALRLARQSIAQDVDALQSISRDLGDEFWVAANLIASCPGLVWVTGVGTSATVGARFAHILTDCGSRSMFLSPDMGIHGHCGAMAPNEVLVAISRGGESLEVNTVVRIATQLGLATLAMVDNVKSTLGGLCQHILPVHTAIQFELGGYCATTSTVGTAAVCDAICAAVLQVKGYTPEEFRRTHPGGAVGLAGRVADSPGGKGQ